MSVLQSKLLRKLTTKDLDGNFWMLTRGCFNLHPQIASTKVGIIFE